MGCKVELLDDGRTVDVHVFDTKAIAEHYLTVSRGYTFERTQPWGETHSLDLYQGHGVTMHASIRQRRGGYWAVVFWDTSKDHPHG